MANETEELEWFRVAEVDELPPGINYYRALLRGGGARRQKQLGYPMIRISTLMVWGEDDVALTRETTYGTGEFVGDLTIRYCGNRLSGRQTLAASPGSV